MNCIVYKFQIMTNKTLMFTYAITATAWSYKSQEVIASIACQIILLIATRWCRQLVYKKDTLKVKSLPLFCNMTWHKPESILLDRNYSS